MVIKEYLNYVFLFFQWIHEFVIRTQIANNGHNINVKKSIYVNKNKNLIQFISILSYM